MKKMHRLLFLLLVTCSLLITSCSEYNAVLKNGDYEYKYEAAKALYMSGNYHQAAELFGSLLTLLKGTPFGEESLYMLAESNMKAKDYESAAMFFKKYYQSYPKGHYMEMARYNSGYALYKQTPDIRLDQTSTMEAINEYQSFLDYCPETTLKSQAQQVIYEMQDKLVRKEYLAAKLYYDLGTYTLNSIHPSGQVPAGTTQRRRKTPRALPRHHRRILCLPERLPRKQVPERGERNLRLLRTRRREERQPAGRRRIKQEEKERRCERGSERDGRIGESQKGCGKSEAAEIY